MGVFTADPTNVHWGYYSPSLEPIARVDDGAIISIQDVPRIDPGVVAASGVVSSEKIPDNHWHIFSEVKDRGPGAHIMVGPILVSDAEPGDTLEVHILEVELAYDYGYHYQSPIGGVLAEETTEEWRRIFRIDRDRKAAEVARGLWIPCTRPFFGNIGVAPRAGRVSTNIPGNHGGNLDNKQLSSGSVLYLPVQVPGALLSVGDGHAAQGDGEVDLTALETGLRGRFQIFVRKDLVITSPRCETSTHWIVMGLNESLDEALRGAVRETIECIVREAPHLTWQEAYMLASVVVDYHVTQAVNGVKSIHGMIPKDVLVTAG